MKKSKKILLIIEELGNINTSGAIVNYNLALNLGIIENNGIDIFTLDNIDKKILNWNYGELFTHPKNNLKKYQKIILGIPKLRGIIQILLGNDFNHLNRINNISKFLAANILNYDSIFLLSNGSSFSPHRAIRALKKNKILPTIVGVFHDPYPLSYYPKPYSDSKNWKDMFKFWSLQKSLKYIDFAVFPSELLFEHYQKDYSFENTKIKIIPHCVDTKINSFNLSNNQINGQINILHAGTLLRPRNPLNFIKVFNWLSNDKIFLKFIGNVDRNLIDSISVEALKNSNVEIINERIPYDTAKKEIQKAKFLLLIEADSDISPFLPTKFVDYLFSGKPIIILGPENSEINRLLSRQYPYYSALNDTQKIKWILDEGIYDENLFNMALEILENLKSYFLPGSIIEKYKEII